jgi:hypothetical protein
MSTLADLPPMSEFGALLFQTAKACEGRPCAVLDRVLTAKVRAWAEDQERLPEPVIAPAQPFEVV